MLVATESQRRIRLNDLAALDTQFQGDEERAKKNSNFTQVYPKGWKRFRKLASGNAGAAALYAMFAEHIDATCGAVICDQQFLATQMQVTTRTVRTWISYLENEGALVRIPVAGRVCAYALDPHEVWKGYNNSKEYAAFMTKTLVNKDGDIKRRIKAMFKSKNPSEHTDSNIAEESQQEAA